MATATLAMAGMWGKPGNRAPDAVFSSAQASGQEARTQTSGSSENATHRLNNEASKNLQQQRARLPGLSEVPRRSRGRRRRESRRWHEKKTDTEFDIVIVPSDGCYMSGSDSDDSDWSVGWFEPHPADFTENDGEESFAVLVPSYGLPASEVSTNSTRQNEEKDPRTPAWAALLANMSSHTSPESQKHLDLWLASLTS